ncbi:MAG: HDIG domain-containing metalloprotein [Planctomycetota bacterium]
MDIAQARALMEEWTQSPALRVHMECVAACMGHYAEKLDPDNKDRWIACGLLHDFDYERHPTADEHPTVGVEHLRGLGVDEEILEAIMGHAAYTGVARTTPMAKALFACDELAGFIVAVAKVRPNGFEEMKAKSVKKKLKDKAFAAAVSREDVRIGTEELTGLTGDEESHHIQNCVDAIAAGVPHALS